MSMPSSSDDVAISAGSVPALRRSSISTRCSRASDPWCERAMVSPASSLIAAASRSASRRLLTKISVERCARMSSTRRGWIAVQIEARPVAEAGPLASSAWSEPRHVFDRHLDRELQRPPHAGIDDRDRAESRRQAAIRRELCVDVVLDLAASLWRRLTARDDFDRVAGVRAAGLTDAAEEPRDFVERPLRRRQADPLHASCAAGPPAARATAPGARRAWSAPGRGSRR